MKNFSRLATLTGNFSGFGNFISVNKGFKQVSFLIQKLVIKFQLVSSSFR